MELKFDTNRQRVIDWLQRSLIVKSYKWGEAVLYKEFYKKEMRGEILREDKMIRLFGIYEAEDQDMGPPNKEEIYPGNREAEMKLRKIKKGTKIKLQN